MSYELSHSTLYVNGTSIPTTLILIMSKYSKALTSFGQLFCIVTVQLPLQNVADIEGMKIRNSVEREKLTLLETFEN